MITVRLASAVPTTSCFADGFVRSLGTTDAVHFHLATTATAITLTALAGLATFFQL